MVKIVYNGREKRTSVSAKELACQRLIAVYVTNIRREPHRYYAPSTSALCWSIYVIMGQPRVLSLRVSPDYPSQRFRKRWLAWRERDLCGRLENRYRAEGDVQP